MVELILNAVTKRLGTTFGGTYRYYAEDVEQDFLKPCFHAMMRMPIQRSKSPVLYDRTMPIVVHYFSDSKNDLKKHYYAMGEKIVECLEYLPFGTTTLRGENISFQIVDDVLQVFVTYKFVTKRVEDIGEPMETLHEAVTHTN